MDVGGLANFIVPFLPLLMRAGESAVEGAANALGKDAWKLANRMWLKLRPKVDESPQAKAAVNEVVSSPDDTDAIASLHVELKKIVKEDGKLAQELAALLDEGQRAGIIAIASGDRSVAAGGDIKGSTIITGDQG